MFKTPYHKQTDPAKQAGQVKNELTLGDYLEKKYPEEMKKKMTFDEWLEKYKYEKGLRDTWGEWDTQDLYECWCVAQENK